MVVGGMGVGVVGWKVPWRWMFRCYRDIWARLEAAGGVLCPARVDVDKVDGLGS